MTQFYSTGASNYVGVANIAAASAWYIDKLGLRKVKVDLDGGEGCIALGFDNDDYALCLGPEDGATDELSPRLNCHSAKKARDFLASRAVTVGEIQQDGQGDPLLRNARPGRQRDRHLRGALGSPVDSLSFHTSFA
jgi:catechol 2,3-dioxygenase-like lactoylglutathione lyase family enzyme